jgi:biopolymer transport protein ExbB
MVNLIGLIEKGGLVTYPLIFCSIISLAVIMEKFWKLRGVVSSTEDLTLSVIPTLIQGNIQSALFICGKYKRSPMASTFRDLLSSGRNQSLRQANDLIEEKRFEEVHKLKGHLWMLGTIGSSAPLIGLLGTVIGIIKSFHSMSIMGTGGFSVVASGISEALIATALGLVVAIFAVIFYNYFQIRIGSINAELKINASKFLDAYKEWRYAYGINRQVGREV